MTEVWGDRRSFALVVEPTGLSADEARSSAARSLVRLQVWCGGHNLCSGRDEEGVFNALEVPLIDLAASLVEGWERRVYDPRLHPVLATRFRYDVPVAARWAMSDALALEPADAASLYAWASVRAMEFAATDYLLPNVVFDRVDDFLRVSWFQRTGTTSFSGVAFAPAQGTVTVDVAEFVAHCDALLSNDAGLVRAGGRRGRTCVQVRAFLGQDPDRMAERVLRMWAPGLDVAATVPKQERIDLARRGRAGPVAGFLRSSAGCLSGEGVKRCLEAFRAVDTRVDTERLASITAGADASLDPARPWESGLRLARHTRDRFSDLAFCAPDGRVPIERILEDLGVAVRRVRLETREVDGACFMDRGGRALAILNPSGRLAATAVGGRSTLAHEFCHVAFDAPKLHALGQAEMRHQPDSILEKRANAFAAELLLPRAVVRASARRGALSRTQLVNLARRFGVGVRLAEHQAENAGIRIDPS